MGGEVEVLAHVAETGETAPLDLGALAGTDDHNPRQAVATVAGNQVAASTATSRKRAV